MTGLTPKGGMLRELTSFGLVGLLATGVYALVANVAIYLVGIEPKAASVLAFIIGSVFSFIVQGRITFGVQKPDWRNVLRFCMQTVISLLISYYAVWLVVDVWTLPAIAGTLAVCVLIPAVNYLGMKSFVFRTS